MIFDETPSAAETPGLVEHAPGENRGMIEIALDAFAHHRFKAFAAQGGCPPPSPKLGKSAINIIPMVVRLIEQQRVVDLDVDAEEIESEFFAQRYRS